MRKVTASCHIVQAQKYEEMVAQIAAAGYEAYQTEPRDNSMESMEKFISSKLVAAGHESVLEHCSISVRFIVDRGVTHEAVRHRPASFTQESTRFCNYTADKFGNEVAMIVPCFWIADQEDSKEVAKQKADSMLVWERAMQAAEIFYFQLKALGNTPEKCRTVLPTSTKSAIRITANIREWRHILNLRALGTTGKPHPQFVEVTQPLLEEFCSRFPVFFQDLEPGKQKRDTVALLNTRPMLLAQVQLFHKGEMEVLQGLTDQDLRELLVGFYSQAVAE